MPLAIVRSLPPLNRAVIPRMLEKITTVGARNIGCDPDQFWAIFQEIHPGEYFEGDLASDEPGVGTHPPLVTIQAQSGRTPEQRLALCRSVSMIVGEALGIPSQNVWIHWQEMAPTDVFVGGKFSEPG